MKRLANENQHRLREALDKVTRFESDLTTKQRELVETREQGLASSVATEALQEELQTQKSAVEVLRTEKKRAEDAHHLKQQQLQEQHKAELNTRNAELSATADRLKQVELQARASEQQVANLKSSLEAEKQKLEASQAAYKEKETEQALLSAEVARAAAQYASKTQELKELEQKLSISEKDKSLVSSQKAAVDAELTESRENLKNTREKLETASTELKAAAGQLEQLRAEQQDKTTVILKQEASLAALEKDLETTERQKQFLEQHQSHRGKMEYLLWNQLPEQSRRRSSASSGIASEAGDDNSGDLPVFEEVQGIGEGSQTLYHRPGMNGSGKALQARDLVMSSLRRLKSISVDDEHGTQLRIACAQLKSNLDKGSALLLTRLDELEKEHYELQCGNESDPPSESPLRQAKKAEYERYLEQLEKHHQTFNGSTGEDYDPEKNAEITRALIELRNRARVAIEALEKREAFFATARSSFSKVQRATPEGSADDQVHTTHVALKILTDHDDPEVMDYVAGDYVRKLVSELRESGRQAADKAEDLESKRKCLALYRNCMLKLLPENLPLDMGEKLGISGQHYLKRIVHDHIRQLEEGFSPVVSEQETVEDVRGETGIRLARHMIDNPRIRPAVLSLLASLQPELEGVPSEVDYYRASTAGLKAVRDEYQLIDMPSMKELLEVVIADLDAANSVMATELERQHRQSSTDKHGKVRRTKLLERCQQYLAKENAEDAKHQEWRGMPAGDGRLKRHPHREVLDCFKPAGQLFAAETEGAPENRGGAVSISHLKKGSEGLLNSFLEGVGGATLATNNKTRQQSLQIEPQGTKPEGVVFKYNRNSERWQVSLADTMWDVDPGFILDHPEIEIPFEQQVTGRVRRDWIPLKSATGETAVLVLRKVPGNARYFLYEKAEDHQLTPRIIGSGNPVQERVEAQFLYDAACAVRRDAMPTPETVESTQVRQLLGASPCWLPKKVSAEQLQAVYSQAERRIREKAAECPLVMHSCDEQLKYQVLSKGTCRTIQERKWSRDSASGRQDSEQPRGGRRLEPYNPELFGHFSVAATFDQVGEHYIEECQKALAEANPFLEEELRDQETFRNGAFRQLRVYQGCELQPERLSAASGGKPSKGTPGYALQALNKVVKINRDHRIRLHQGVDEQRYKLLSDLRATNPEELQDYSDRELLEYVMVQFEQGRLPKELNTQDYSDRLGNLMLAGNDLVQATRLQHKLASLQAALEKLERDARILAKDPAYARRCQEWNLEMAIVASEQEAVASRLDSYSQAPLASGVRARMSFECRVGTVLRENQVEEVQEAVEDISRAMDDPDGTMSRITQKGTGWGKSTILKLLADHACAHNVGCPERSVLVIAPESNQAELDISLGHYFARKHTHYQRLNIQKYTDQANRWWTENNLDEIHNILLGIPANTSVKQRSRAVSKVRAPVGASVRDIQTLMQLRASLQKKNTLDDRDRRSLVKLDQIADLVRESMVFCDEWDSTLMPPREADLEGLVTGVNHALREMRTELTARDIMQNHGLLIQGCRRKQLLSATVGSAFTAAVASGASEPREVKAKCHIDPFTTQQRFWHWLNQATPVYMHLRNKEGRQQVLNQVVDEVGSEREILIFDGNSLEGKTAEQAVQDHKLLARARSRQGAEPKGTLYYDQNKKLHMYLQGDAVYGTGQGAPVPREELSCLRADVTLSQREAVGTDAPQRQSSVGVHMGLLEQSREGRANYMAQQVGRLMRASNEPRKPQKLYVVVDLDTAKELETNENESVRNAAQAFSQSMKILEQAKGALTEELSCEFRHCSPEQQKAIYAPLDIKPEATDMEERSDRAITAALESELDRLAENEWLEAGFTKAQMPFLRAYKQQEWKTRQAYLMMTAAELARREITDHTQHCEALLQGACVDSHLDQVCAAEHGWLQNSMHGSLQEFNPDRETREKSLVTRPGSIFAWDCFMRQTGS